MKIEKKKKIAGKYIFSGLFKTTIQILAGFVIFRWIDPKSLGYWQSFTVIVSYLTILNLGVTVGINREIPYWIGKGNNSRGLTLLQTAKYYVRILGLLMILIGSLFGLFFYIFEIINLEGFTFLILALVLTTFNLNVDLFGATYRSSSAFNRLANIQFVLTVLYILFIPLIYYFEIWGYIFYLLLISAKTVFLLSCYSPLKAKHKFRKEDFIYLVKVGLPIYFWNYVNSQIQSFPRLVLILIGTPYLVGLYAPSWSIRQAMLNIPKYTNRYLFPQMSHRYGKTDSQKQVSQFAIRSAIYLFSLTFLGGAVFAYSLNYIFPVFFPEYQEGIVAAQIMIFSGVFYGTNLIFHNALNALMNIKIFKTIIGLKVVTIFLTTYLASNIFSSLLVAVSIGSLLSEMVVAILYYINLNRLK
ncbi:lipopolysaccharide biosynthesis protein [Winogradskyella poriferorum]|uniref:lipopolysaccharide biosynthesis protein n=1 Tax=Winogradskyella poriferorum TaxID=307627 RepID=UPI003D651451